MKEPAATESVTRGLHILWLATKVPWPAVDGGRLVVHLSIAALIGRGHHVTLVAPGDDGDEVPGDLAKGVRLETVDSRHRPRWQDALTTLTPLGNEPWTIRRHASRSVRRRAAQLVCEARAEGRAYDVVHVEQVQALAGIDDIDQPPPVVLRAQNVESDLWLAMAEHRLLARLWMRREASRLADYEARAACRVSATLALTAFDARRLEELAAPRADRFVQVVAAPFPRSLESPAATILDGDPAIVLFGSASWWPNRHGADWFLRHVWPTVARALPSARLHIYGFVEPVKGVEARDRISVRKAPGTAAGDSAAAFAPGSILAVPLFVASGVRMKILEAWARRVPVVATPAAARGLVYDDGCELMVCQDAGGFAEAFATLRESRSRQRMLDAAQRRLETSYAPMDVAENLEMIYRGLASSR